LRRGRVFPDLKLNYTENLLRVHGDVHRDQPAVTAIDSTGRRVRMSRGELADAVEIAAGGLQSLGLRCGDIVASVAYNDERAIVGALSAARLGATLSSASPEMGAFSIVARFEQLSPRLLLCHFRDLNPELPNTLGERLSEIIAKLPTLRAVVALDDGPIPLGLNVPVVRLSELKGKASEPCRVPFNWPLFVLFSSGTTGRPKCIVHGVGGTLIEHVKEHRLHCNLMPGDKLFFQTSCAWMMWNWQLSALASDVELVLYAGPVLAPETLWNIVGQEGVSAFGTSPAFLQLCQDRDYVPQQAQPLGALKMMFSTGSILFDHQFVWVRDHVGDLPLQSISGGTDIIGCFVLGNPLLPVYRGEAQCRSLGLDVHALVDASQGTASTIGELICRNPFPSRPVYFHGDADGRAFHKAYFSQNEGVWSHGDLIEFSPQGSARLHGRSDSVLNVRGVRVGPAEIYRILMDVPAVKEAMAVEQALPNRPGHSRMVLLVVLNAGCTLDGALRRQIKLELSSRGSSAHVPDAILDVPELPVTHTGKRSEAAARDVLNGVTAVNAGALKNPNCLNLLAQRLQQDEERRAQADLPNSDQATDVRALLTQLFEQTLDIAPVLQDDNFFELGGTSLTALQVLQRFQQCTGQALQPSVLFESPTIARLLQQLQNGRTGQVSPLVRLKPGSGQQTVYFIPGLGGDPMELANVAKHLPDHIAAVGFRSCGLHPGEDALTDVTQMAEYFIHHLRQVQPDGPYALVGYSFGGLVAFEMARLLSRDGSRLQFVGLLDSSLDLGCQPKVKRFQYKLASKLHTKLGNIGRARPALKNTMNGLRLHLAHWLHATANEPVPLPWAGMSLTPQMQAVLVASEKAYLRYRPQPAGIPLTYFRSSYRAMDLCECVGVWRAASLGHLKVINVQGNHFSIIQGSLAAQLCARIAAHLIDVPLAAVDRTPSNDGNSIAVQMEPTLAGVRHTQESESKATPIGMR
jgi:acetoacetyl-CoA synthetase